MLYSGGVRLGIANLSGRSIHRSHRDSGRTDLARSRRRGRGSQPRRLHSATGYAEFGLLDGFASSTLSSLSG